MSLLIFGTVVVGLFGAIIGSFLNVVIYRLPNDISISEPRWSFCPNCKQRIRPADNIPILGWLILRGKCRACGESISPRYPIVECLTALVFLTIWDAIFAANVYGDWTVIKEDWPLLVSMLTMAAVLIAISAMDIEAYTVDIRPLWFAMAVGTIAFSAWFALRGMDVVPRFLKELTVEEALRSAKSETDTLENRYTVLPASLSIIGAAMGVVWVLTEIVVGLIRRQNDEAQKSDEPKEIESSEATPDSEVSQAPGFKPWLVLLFVAVLIAVVVGVIAQAAGVSEIGQLSGWRGWLACIIVMGAVILASMEHREADHQIIEEIEAESPMARSMALHEFAYLLPSIVVGIVLFATFLNRGLLDKPLDGFVGFSRLPPVWLGISGGLIYALASMVFAAALGWSLRILGTLGFGKEAFGAGDIFILGAIGACLGFWGAFFSLFLAVFLALFGTILTLLSKKARAIPFGPWLSLGAIVYIWLGPDLLGYWQPVVTSLWRGIVQQ